jgi:hypothetical protein
LRVNVRSVCLCHHECVLGESCAYRLLCTSIRTVGRVVSNAVALVTLNAIVCETIAPGNRSRAASKSLSCCCYWSLE